LNWSTVASNPWVITIGGSVGVTFVVWLGRKVFQNSRKGESTGGAVMTQNFQPTINIHPPVANPTEDRVSVGAAKASIQTLREIERAWIAEEIRFPDRIPRRSETGGGGVLCVSYAFNNIGKQPAFIRNIQTRFHAPTSKLPDKPEYRVSTFTPDPQIGENGRLLAPGEAFYCSTFLEEGSLDDDQIDQISQGRLTLYTYGRVQYESVGLRGINQFCYKWHDLVGFSVEGEKEGFRKGGPPEYNRVT
jgi:hypothetical protein